MQTDPATLFARAACAHSALVRRAGLWAVYLAGGDLHLQRILPGIAARSAHEAYGRPLVGVYDASVPLPEFVADVRATVAA